MYNYYRALAGRPVREHDPGGVRPAPCVARRPDDRRPPGGGADRARGRRRPADCTTTWRPSTTPTLQPTTDDQPFPYLPDRTIPRFYLVMLGLILARLVAAGAGRRRPAAADAPVRRPVLHGRGVPAAGDQERGAVRAAVRHHLVRQRAGLRRRAARGAGGDRDGAARQAATAGAALRRRCSPRWCWPGSIPPAALLSLPLVPRFLAGGRARVRPDLPGQPGLRAAVPRRGVVDGRVRREPARRDGRRRCWSTSR